MGNESLLRQLRSHHDALFLEGDSSHLSDAADAIESLQSRLAAVEAERERLERALRRYGEHDEDCMTVAQETYSMRCRCGWDAVRDSLAAAAARTEEEQP